MTGIGRFTSQEAEEQWGVPTVVPPNTWSAFVLMLEDGALGMRYIPLAPVSAIAVSEGAMLGGRLGLQI